MKYDRQRVVSAIYDNDSKNPLIAALPYPLEQGEFYNRIQSFPTIPNDGLTMRERKKGLSTLQTIFVPLNYMYSVYDELFRLMQSTYHTRTSKQNIAKINAMFTDDDGRAYITQPQSASLLGSVGIGKSTTIKHCLDMMPQVIEHEQFNGETFFCKQILYLFCECPSDASIRTMSFNIVRAIDDAVGGNHIDYLVKMRSTAVSSVATYIKVLCLTYNIGLICVDEIQNLIITAKRDNRIKPMIRFLTELTNDTATAVYFSGTTLAETVFEQEPYLKRRTRGLRLLPFRNDATYRDFLTALWPYQYTEKKAKISDKLFNTFYDYSGGVPSYIVKLFEESQAQALLQNYPCIDEKLIRNTADLLAIKPMKSVLVGTFLSDFKEGVASQILPQNSNSDSVYIGGERRLFANKRGRKPSERDAVDLIIAYQNEQLIPMMKDNQMLQVFPLC